MTRLQIEDLPPGAQVEALKQMGLIKGSQDFRPKAAVVEQPEHWSKLETTGLFVYWVAITPVVIKAVGTWIVVGVLLIARAVLALLVVIVTVLIAFGRGLSSTSRKRRPTRR